MKNLSLNVLIFTGYSLETNAQNNQVNKPFNVELGFGITIQESGSNGGIFYINPGYTFAGRFRTGIQLEGLADNIKTIGSSILTFDYYFINKKNFRLSVGAGYGFYNSSFDEQAFSIPEWNQTQWTTGKMGSMIRIGFEWHHLRLGIAYNIVPTMYVSTTLFPYPTSTDTYKNGYLALKLGISIGGGKK